MRKGSLTKSISSDAKIDSNHPERLPQTGPLCYEKYYENSTLLQQAALIQYMAQVRPIPFFYRTAPLIAKFSDRMVPKYVLILCQFLLTLCLLSSFVPAESVTLGIVDKSSIFALLLWLR